MLGYSEMPKEFGKALWVWYTHNQERLRGGSLCVALKLPYVKATRTVETGNISSSHPSFHLECGGGGKFPNPETTVNLPKY